MKKFKISFNYIILALICQFFLCCVSSAQVSATSTNNFYFDKFEADYYLEKADDGTSRLKVVEELTAVFPDYNQNKGICRMIPFLNKGGDNRTLEDEDIRALTVTRNGDYEPIYSIEKSGNYYEVCTGTDEYVTGIQVYVFTYQFKNVVTEFSNSEKGWQELYWNTNGTGWSQKFNSLVARVHLPDDNTWTGDSWCYVGSYGESGQDRCIIEKSDDSRTVTFSASNLAAGENLTFDLELEPNSFIIPEPEKNYIAFIILAGVIAICALILIRPIKKFRQTAEKRRFYKGYFIKPEYQPHPDYSLLEMAQIYLGGKKDPKVALLLKMVVEGRIELIKGEEKMFGDYNWSVRVKNLQGISREEEIILKILNAGNSVTEGEEIKIERHLATAELVNLGNSFEAIGGAAAKRDGLIIKAAEGLSSSNKFSSIVLIAICFIFFGLPALTSILSVLSWLFGDIAGSLTGSFISSGVEYVGAKICYTLGILIISTVVLTYIILFFQYHKYLNHNLSGLEASRYMDGLKLYIKMAEKDRLNFLQSVKGADTSPTGIVKLYEKLLPYAALFGLEESWMGELEKYYQLKEVGTPDWYMMNNMIAFHEINGALHAASNFSTASTHYSDSSSSGGSGFSGGGGGGFSGGGGGGGGGGGR